MTKQDKLIHTILGGLSDQNIEFNDLCTLLKRLGFNEHIHGSHHIFRKDEVVERINLQQDGAKAKHIKLNK